jgi:hypothetical protein
MLGPVTCAWTVARFGAALGCGLLLAGTLTGCGGTKTVTERRFPGTVGGIPLELGALRSHGQARRSGLRCRRALL